MMTYYSLSLNLFLTLNFCCIRSAPCVLIYSRDSRRHIFFLFFVLQNKYWKKKKREFRARTDWESHPSPAVPYLSNEVKRLHLNYCAVFYCMKCTVFMEDVDSMGCCVRYWSFFSHFEWRKEHEFTKFLDSQTPKVLHDSQNVI